MTKRKNPEELLDNSWRSPFAMSDAEIAAELGVSRQRVSQIATVAMLKIRAEFLKRGYKAEDFYDTIGGAK